MSKRAPAPTRLAYLVEHYRPGVAAAGLSRAVACVQRAFHELELEGQPVRFRHSTIVASDESFLCVVEARSEDLVRLAYARAGVPFERISAALTEQD